MSKEKLNKGHWHEATDRTHCVMDIIEHMLYEHPAIAQTPALKNIVEEVQELLGKVYQEAGAKM